MTKLPENLVRVKSYTNENGKVHISKRDFLDKWRALRAIRRERPTWSLQQILDDYAHTESFKLRKASDTP